jgi:recombination protein RecR
VYSAPIQDLIDEFGRLPGIGPKSAQRITFHLLRVPAIEAERLAKAIVEAKQRVKFCHTCYNLSELERCEICSDDQRDGTVICVVEDARDLIAVERTSSLASTTCFKERLIQSKASVLNNCVLPS